jgi:hypothetical protein
VTASNPKSCVPTLLLALVLAACEDKPPAPTASPAPPPAPTSVATSTTTTTATVGYTPGPAKTYDCGARDQKPCPMQAWMKRVMAPASSSNDGAELAKALTYVAEHAPPGFTDWSSIAKAGAAKAKEGEFDAAKAACKQCHDSYKDQYKTTMRDRPF